MEKIPSFKVDHRTHPTGVHVSRIDKVNETYITTFDIRVTAPNTEAPMSTTGAHSIEHLFATFLRNSYSDIIYFGPMGCRTGFYLIVSSELSTQQVADRLLKWATLTLSYECTEEGKPKDSIPGQSEIECGNFKDLSLDSAKIIAELMLERMIGR